MSYQFIGEIRMFGGKTPPDGWLLCQGQLLSTEEYSSLFVLLGTTYGGDGEKTFGIPDLASRVPVDQGMQYALGQRGGAETVGLTPDNLPPHTHLAQVDQAADQSSPVGNFWGGGTLSAYAHDVPPTTLMNSESLLPAGGRAYHENMPPFLCINFMIATDGIVPAPGRVFASSEPS